MQAQYAQLVWFDGPRSPEHVAAADYAGRNRITPALLADPIVAAGHVATYVLRQPDGTQVVITLAKDEVTLDRGNEIIMSSPLLPEEDPALLGDPDRIHRFEVLHVVDEATKDAFVQGPQP